MRMGEMNPVRAWVLAARPQTLAVGVAPVSAATGIATADGVYVSAMVTASFLCVVFLQVATNLANDYFDFVKGADTAERLGPARATQTGFLSPKAVFLGMSASLMLAAGAGGYLAGAVGWPVWVLGAVCLACAVAYTGGPWPLAYHGLGDLFVFVFFGPVAVAGTYYVQAHHLSEDALLVGVGVGAFSTAVLVVNNLRDRKTDEAAGKRTLAVRFGDKFAVYEYMACLLVALLTPLAGVLLVGWSLWTFVSVLGVLSCITPALVVASCAKATTAPGKPGATAAESGVVAVESGVGGAQSRVPHTNRRELNAALAATARSVLLYGLLLATGFMSGALWG